MSIVVLKLPDVKLKSETRPKKCPYCSEETFQGWGQVSKPVRDSLTTRRSKWQHPLVYPICYKRFCSPVESSLRCFT